MPPKSDSEVVEVVESDHFASKSSLDLTLVVIDSPAKREVSSVVDAVIS